MTFELCDFSHFRVLPDAKLVVDVTMGGEDLFVMGIPEERADLTICGDLVDHLTGICVPEHDALVSAASA